MPHLFKSFQAVSLTTTPCTTNTNVVPVISIFPKTEHEVSDSIAICLRTIHGVKSPYTIIEFIEMQRNLGIDHIYIYDFENITKEVENVLHYYTTIGVVSIIPWKLPVKNSPVFDKEGDIAIHGQFALINDCMYRSMNHHRYVINHDLDEYIIPRDPAIKTIREVINEIHHDRHFDKRNKYAAYGFLNCYFCLNQSDYENRGPQLVTLKRRVRHICLTHELEEAWWKDNGQTHIERGFATAMKVIAYPSRVIMMGVHSVSVPMPGCLVDLIVSTDIATKHHYKIPYKLGCAITDNTLADKYRQGLIYRVNSVCEETGLNILTFV